MALRDDLLPVADLGSQLARDFGLSRYAVSVRVRTWNGDIGDVAAGFTDSTMPIDPPPSVNVMSPLQAQIAGIMMAAGTVEDLYWKLEDITPQYLDAHGSIIGGFTPAQLFPPVGPNQELEYILTGDDGVPFSCTVVEKEFDDPFEYNVILREKRRRTEQNAP